ncbi:monovalent cation/H+ antiporter subunit D [Roseateles albus]|uniref:Monovalent cation/H+ antiporter subunit D n=2 Tax=Roseateles albus TaxID=2987525 RepID=A0ABT5KBV3_9BURK|nr:monovalent cation/H+ antiporter subunit D [Roseateles albus]MDC8770475.1 monovalent cation/H+ antiporter subunit D [Roseateles albus]
MTLLSDWALLANAALMPHLTLAPILLPLIAACLLLLLGDRRHHRKATLALAATLANLAIALFLMLGVHMEAAQPHAFGVYLPSNWDVPFGIVLVLDHLSALMLVVAAVVALMALLFSLARWHKAGAHFHVLLQLQIMGLNGAFLTGDLFNLFVFFEVMLAASYGLLLHGSGPARVKAGLHYLSINLVASSLFLVGAALIYGVTGTLNMADLAARIPLVAAADRALLHVGCAILALAFLAKAACWPLNFWLAPAYTAASAPSAAVFALLTKVGVYVLMRLSTLLFSASAGASAGFGQSWLLWGGMATLSFGAIGMLSAQRPARLASFAVIVSSGTLMAVLGFARPELSAGALYYLPVSTFAVAAFFLLAELMDRSRNPSPQAPRAPEDEEDHLPFALAEQELAREGNLDEDEERLVGRAIPAATALLGLAFICCTLLVAGLPPLASFVAKFAMLSALLQTSAAAGGIAPSAWLFLSLLIAAGLLALIALSRTGIRFFWTPVDRSPPSLQLFEYAPIVMLIALCGAMTWHAEGLLRYANTTAELLYSPQRYIDAVLSARPLLTPTNAERLRASTPPEPQP